MGSLDTFVKWRWVRALALWNQLPIRAQGGITVLIPLVAVLVSFAFAIYGNRNRATLQDDIGRKFTAVRQYGDLLNLMVDAETGERGFMLTERGEYLAPYQKAVEEIPNTIAALRQTIENEPGDKPRAERLERLGKIQDLINRELALLKEAQQFERRSAGSPNQINEYLERGKSIMDEIRRSIGELQNKEETLLNERLEEINSIRWRDYLVIFVTLVIGILVRVVSFYLFDRGIVRRVNRLSEYVEGLINGAPANYIESKKTDAVGELEQKIIKLAKQI